MTTPLEVAGWVPWLRNRAASVAPASTPPGSITFPSTPLKCGVYLAIGADLTKPPTSWVWTDVSDYVRASPGISTTQGRDDWTSTVRTSSAQLALSNRDGRFSRRNPNSPYYGQLTFNTPIWMTVDGGAGPVTRFQGFVNEWPTRWTPDSAATDSTVPIQCAGIMRRLQQGTVLNSPVRRAVTGTNPVAYWPMEDSPSVSLIASAITGGTSLPQETTDTRTGHSGLCDGAGLCLNLQPLVSGTANSKVPLSLASIGSSWSFGFVARLNVASIASMTLLQFDRAQVAGAFYYVQVNLTSQTLAFVFRDGSLATPPGLTITTPVVAADVGTTVAPHYFAVTLVQVGADTVVTVYMDGSVVGTGTMTGVTNAGPTGLLLGPNGSEMNMANPSYLLFGHLAVCNNTNLATIGASPSPINAYVGELATSRIRRLAAEEGVPMVCTSGVSAAMGLQGTDTFLNLLRECEAADMGVIYETNWGLGYQSLNDRINQPVSMALDFNQGHIAVEPQPADDDQRLRNKWTVSRATGSEATAQLISGPLGTLAAGLYDDSVTVNLYVDSQLFDQAGWRLHLSTVDEDRWPSLSLRFNGTPSLIPLWAAMPFGGRITVANPLSQGAPNIIDAIVEGWSEYWDGIIWVAEVTTSPASPYAVAIATDPSPAVQEVPRLGSGTATLSVGISSGDASFGIVSGTGGLWTTVAADFPLDVNIDGERIRLSTITGAASPQTATVSARSVNGIVKAHTAGAAIEVWRIATVGLI